MRQNDPHPKYWEELHEQITHVLRYDPEQGSFYWENPTSIRTPKGSIAGRQNNVRGVLVQVLGRAYTEPRLAVFYMTGQFPIGRIRKLDTAAGFSPWNNLRYTLPNGKTYIGSQEVSDA